MSQNDEVLVRVEGVSKKFCRSLKKSLWYGVCDIASELNPFGRTAAVANSLKNLTTEDTTERLGRSEEEQTKFGPKGEVAGATESKGGAGLRLSGQAGSAFSNPTTSGLAVDSQNTSLARAASNPCSSGEKALDSRCSTHDSAEGLRDGEFFAVKDVSFELRRGECLGLIGHNGAGKTTLLKMLNGLIKPDRGSITMRGRVGALIALGAGFNPILTGRENIYINGSVLGLTKKEIDARIDEIIDFAEIREFIDMPVQSYSSGMAVRLGFSVATAMHPDVLILDEVLAVGDAAFRNKCYQRIGAIKKTTAVIFVSHNMEQVGRICELAILLREGSVLCNGPAEKAIQQYELLCSHKDIKGDGFLKLSDVVQHLEIIPQKVEIICGQEWLVKVSMSLLPMANPSVFRAVFYSSSGEWVADAVATWPLRDGFVQNPGECVFKVSSVTLRNGIYRMSFHIIDESGTIIAWAHKMHDIQITGASKYNAAVSVLSAVLEN